MSESDHRKSVEPEFQGPFWKHPYFVYAILNLILFLGLVLAAYLAVKNGWIPTR